MYCYQKLDDPSKSYHDKCSKKIFGTIKYPKIEFGLDEVRDLAKEAIQKRVAIPGVQPKLSLAFEQTETLDRLTIVGLWDGLYVLKPPNPEYPELPENEDVTMHMAQISGIETAEHCLVRLKSGELAYLAKRFDRQLKRKKVTKIHQEDMCQVAGLLTEHKYDLSLEKVAKAVETYTTYKGLELLEFFKVTVFSFLVGNSDMHLKNYSLVFKNDGSIKLSPAYDLLSTSLATPEDKEDTALTLNGKKKKIKIDDFHILAKRCNLNQKAFDSVLEGFEKNLINFKKIIEQSFLSEKMAADYLKVLSEKAKRLEINIPDGF